MKARLAFAGVAVLAGLAGAALYFGARLPGSAAVTPAADATPGAIYSARFLDTGGNPRSLGQFEGRVVVVNFWATWCTPCREEMPAFVRLQERWAGRGVQFVGLAADEPDKVARFGRELAINYPLWTGDPDVMPLSKRLGNRLGVLPHTVILDRQGKVVDSRIGIYEESALEARFATMSAK